MSAVTYDASLPGQEALDDTLATHVLDVLLRGGERADPTADPSKDKVLEVVQVFGDSVVDLKHFAPGRAVSLGATLVKSLRGTRMVEDFFVPTSLLPSPTHPLFEATAGGWACVVHPTWEGFVEGPAGRRSLATLAALVTPGADGLLRLPIGADDNAVIHVGTTIFVARPVFPSKRVPVTGRDAIDYPMLGIAGFMGFVAMMMGVALSVLPAPPKGSGVEDPSRLVEIMLNRPLDTPLPPTPKPEASGEKAKGPEGKAGEPEAKLAKAKSLDIRKKNADVAASAGILGALNDNAMLESTLGDSALPSALSAGIGGLIGPKGTQVGVGLGQRGAGFGGGGTAEYAGGLGTLGKGRAASCPGCDGLGERSKPAEVHAGGEVLTLGSLDKALIDQVVKRNMSQIRYCYQRELTKNPALNGKVTVKFVIGRDGSVSSASTKSSTMANANVESCINGRFMRFQFPEPKGGGIVVVSYPFLFSPG